MDHRRQDLEVESLIVERGYSLTNYLIGEFKYRFFRHFIPSGDFHTAQRACQIGGSRWSQVEDNPAFNVASKGDLRRNAAALVRVLRHEDFAHTGAAAQALCQHRIRRIDEGLDQLHLHAWAPSATMADTTASS